jgi:acetyl esterase/lipase
MVPTRHLTFEESDLRQSWQSRVFNTWLRLFAKRRHPPDGGIFDMRRRIARLDAAFARRNSTSTERLTMAGLNCDRISVAASHNDRIIYYLHGGGFVMALPNAQTAMISRWCSVFGSTAYMPDYRLAPEHPYPAAPNDCLTGYRWLLENGASPSNIVMVGDSAGGCLTLVTLQRIREQDLPMPACSVLLSPVADLTMCGQTFVSNERKDPMFTMQALLLMRNAYATEQSVTEPAASPLFGDFDGLPPMKILAGGTEMLLSDSLRVADKARASGVDVELDIWPKMPHVFPAVLWLPESRAATNAIAKFVAKHAGWAR